MFFFIGGLGPRTVSLDEQARICSNCGRFTLTLKRTDQYLSLFFIPLFRVKKGEPFLICGNCGTIHDERGGRRHGGWSSKEQACRYCGRPSEPDFKYCPECGRPIVER